MDGLTLNVSEQSSLSPRMISSMLLAIVLGQWILRESSKALRSWNLTYRSVPE